MLDSPQTSEVFSEKTTSMSNRDTLVSKNNNMNLINNFVSGYVPVDNTKTPRGRKTFAFWTLVLLLFILAIGNLILTMTILTVLRLGQGMESIELIPKEETIKFFGDVDLDHIYKRDGVLEGYEDEPVEVTSTNAPVQVKLYSRTGRPVTKLQVNTNETAFKAINSFLVKNEREESLFTVTNPVFKSIKGGKDLITKRIQTSKIRSPIQKDLNIVGDSIHLKGAEGTKIEGKEVIWSADEEIYLSSNGSIVLSGHDGVYVDVSKIPKAHSRNNRYLTGQFKLCVCMPGGKLFKIPVANPNKKVHCNNIDMQRYNPCI